MAERKAPPGQYRQEPASETWDTLPWRKLEQHVFRIQKRIYRARQRGNTRAVQKLQKLLMKSEAARLLAVRRATEAQGGEHIVTSAGTPRVHPQRRLAMAQEIHPRGQQHSPASKTQALTRARQALVRAALEPEWEAVRTPACPDFRPGRTARDAIEALSHHVSNRQYYVLVAGIHHGFTTLNHHALLAQLRESTGMRRMIRVWLKAGLMSGSTLTPTINGIPQEDILPPLLAQIALHGLEQAVTETQDENAEQAILIRYADRFVLLHSRLADIEQAARKLETHLNDLGLQLDPARTSITHTLTSCMGKVGFDFSGYSFRQYPVGKAQGKPAGFKAVIKPGKEAVREHLEATAERIHKLRAVSQKRLIREINPLIATWSHYYGLATSADVHAHCDHILHQQLLSWARYRHPKKGMAWLIAKYWPDLSEAQRWTFRNNYARLRRHRETTLSARASDNLGLVSPAIDAPRPSELTLQQREHTARDRNSGCLRAPGDPSGPRAINQCCRAETRTPVKRRVSASGARHTGPYTEEPYEGKLSRTVREWRSEERSSRRP
ncbi:MAG TPA: reverse transcriptase N-terminal domain-containing protein [Ktedonobacteraceae bacterium]